MSEGPQNPPSAFKALSRSREAARRAQEAAVAAESASGSPQASTARGSVVETGRVSGLDASGTAGAARSADAGGSPAPSGSPRKGSRFKAPRLEVVDATPHSAPEVCPHCTGKGYILFSAEAFARARLCECQKFCAKCRGQGYTLVQNETGYLYHMPCECRGIHQRLERFNQALIPSHFTHKDLNSFETLNGNELLLNRVVGFAGAYPEDRRGLLVVGDSGVGKTHLLVGVLKVLTLEKGLNCLFKDFFLLLSEVRQAWDTGSYVSEIIRPLIEVEVLVVDELGKGRTNSDWETALLDEIICKRYNELKTTLFTTNFLIPTKEEEEKAQKQEEDRAREGGHSQTSSGSSSRYTRGGQPVRLNVTDGRMRETLEQRVGERIFSRLKHMCEILRVRGLDYRRTHAAALDR